MKKLLVLATVFGCHGGGPATTAGSASGSGGTCAAKLDELAKFYDAVATVNAQPKIPGLHQAAMEAGVDKLPPVTNAPIDLAKSDVLVVGKIGLEMVFASGERGRLVTDNMGGLEAPDTKTSLVLYIDESVPWQRVEQVHAQLKTDKPYASYAVAYSSEGALAGRTPPQVPGSEPGRADLPTILEGIDKTATAHCPDYAKLLDALKTHAREVDPDLVRSLGQAIPHCDCGVDMAELEAFPWIVAKPALTMVPFSSSAPPLHGADSATWGDLVRDAKGPVPMPPPPPLPPPPPPPPPHRR